jgi:hypothetical protein
MSTSRLFLRTATAAALVLGGAAMLTTSPGCSDKGRMAIPNDADRLASGRGEVTATATRDGEVWILDKDDNRIVWSGDVRREDRIEIETKDNRIRVGGETKSERPLDSEHEYVIYIRR